MSKKTMLNITGLISYSTLRQQIDYTLQGNLEIIKQQDILRKITLHVANVHKVYYVIDKL